MRSSLLLRPPVCNGLARSRLRTGAFRRSIVTLRKHATDKSVGTSKTPSFSRPTTPCRTRFAPSPTGNLHLGSLRTALFNYLLAKGTGGQFILRVEDTDQARLVHGAEQRLYDDLAWAGLSWDEGPNVGGKFGPYRQSERLHHYHHHLDELLQQGKAYRCFCTPEDLDNHKKQALAERTSEKYPGTCRSISAEESEERAARGDLFAVRFKSSETPIEVDDIVYKKFKSKQSEDDFIIWKRDGFPTYHFANVIDDHLMDISHVIRGAEWLVSTPKHVDLYRAFGWQPPQFAHVGLLVDQKRQKLSKRHPGVDMSWYQQRQVLPPALLNFAVLLGWNHGGGDDTMSLEDMVEKFNLRFSKGDIIVNMDKLEYFQRNHSRRIITGKSGDTILKTRYLDPLANIIRAAEDARRGLGSNGAVDTRSIDPLLPSACLDDGDATFKEHIRHALQITKLQDEDLEAWVRANKYLIWEIPTSELRSLWRSLNIGHIKQGEDAISPAELLDFFAGSFSAITSDKWVSANLEVELKRLVGSATFHEKDGQDEIKYGGFKFLRWSLLGSPQGPSLAAVMELLGKEQTMSRLKSARDALAA